MCYIIKHFKKNINDERDYDEKTKLHEFLTNYNHLYWILLTHVICVCIPVSKKVNRSPLPHHIGIPCWLVQTATLCYMMAYRALKTGYDPISMLAWFAVCMILALFGMTLGGWLMKFNHPSSWVNLGSAFLVLGFMLVVTLQTIEYLNLGGMSYKTSLVVWIMVGMFFYIIDIQLILDGRYHQMDKGDYIFASMKLTADFVLFFSLMLKTCSSA